MNHRYLLYGIALILAILVAAVILPGFIAGILMPGDRVVSMHIDPVTGSSSVLTATHTFPFERSTITLTIPVDNAVYLGARRADKGVTIYGNVSEKVWLADSYRAMVTDPAQDPLYHSLTGEFRKIRAEDNLTDDEYLELMTAYVQSLRYETLPENPAKFPVETVVDGSGDCDDKSLLLAGLLSREGYRVSLFSFGPENHMTVGVGSGTYLYRNTGYAFVETTNFSFVGVPTTKLETGVLLKSDPIVIPIGDGTKTYQQGDETRLIENASEIAGERAVAMEPQITSTGADLDAKHAMIADLEAQMAAMKNAGDMSLYNNRLPKHNALVGVYNTELAGYQQSFEGYQGLARLHNYILLNAFDRKGVFDYVRSNLTVLT